MIYFDSMARGVEYAERLTQPIYEWLNSLSHENTEVLQRNKNEVDSTSFRTTR